MQIQSSTENGLVGDVIAHDAQGQTYTRVLGAEVTISQRLNPLFRQNQLL